MQISKRYLLPVLSIVLVLIAAGGLYARQALKESCDVNAVREASAFLVIQMKEFDDVYISTTNGFRTSITFPVTVMQQILVDTQQTEVPGCMQTAKRELLGYMRDAIRAFQAFTLGEPDATIQGLLNDSYSHIRIFIRELEAVKECAPYCLR